MQHYIKSHNACNVRARFRQILQKVAGWAKPWSRVSGSNPTKGEIISEPKRHFLALQSRVISTSIYYTLASIAADIKYNIEPSHKPAYAVWEQRYIYRSACASAYSEKRLFISCFDTKAIFSALTGRITSKAVY